MQYLLIEFKDMLFDFFQAYFYLTILNFIFFVENF